MFGHVIPHVSKNAEKDNSNNVSLHFNDDYKICNKYNSGNIIYSELFVLCTF